MHEMLLLSNDTCKKSPSHGRLFNPINTPDARAQEVASYAELQGISRRPQCSNPFAALVQQSSPDSSSQCLKLSSQHSAGSCWEESLNLWFMKAIAVGKKVRRQRIQKRFRVPQAVAAICAPGVVVPGCASMMWDWEVVQDKMSSVDFS